MSLFWQTVSEVPIFVPLCKETILERSSASLVVVLDRYLSHIFQHSVGVRRQRGRPTSGNQVKFDQSSASLTVVLDRYISYIFQYSVGVRRQKVELLLPGGTDGSGYPGGTKQQFGAVRGMVEALLLQLKQLPDFQVRIMLDR